MKVYEKCDDCLGSGYTEDLMCCRPCDGEGFKEIDIPIEQCVEALREAKKDLCFRVCYRESTCDEPCKQYVKFDEIIKAAEEFLK